MAIKKKFKGGAHPPEKKLTSTLQIVDMPYPDQVVIPLQQHIGAPAEAIVEKGEHVKTGQIIGKSTKFVSVPVHASITGTVKSIEKQPHPLGVNVLSIIIESDEEKKDDFTWSQSPQDGFMELSAEQMKERISNAGIAGMGGASFPTHVKLSPPSEKPIDTLILNGVECEPYLTADHRLMLEKPEDILNGVKIIMKILGVNKGIIGIEKNKPDAIRLMKQMVNGEATLSVVALPVKYPQGAEKQLIKAVTGRSVPSGGLPMDIGCVVQNVGTALAVYEAVAMGKPLIERVLTITGPGIAEPKNVKARLGASFLSVIEFAGGYQEAASKVINGGPMMGIAQVVDTVPVIKGTSGILVLDDKAGKMVDESPCIGCARCVDTCPMNLVPTEIASMVRHKKIGKLQDLGILDCMECGTCGFVCPSKIHLVHYIKLGKALLNDQKKSSAA